MQPLADTLRSIHEGLGAPADLPIPPRIETLDMVTKAIAELQAFNQQFTTSNPFDVWSDDPD